MTIFRVETESGPESIPENDPLAEDRTRRRNELYATINELFQKAESLNREVTLVSKKVAEINNRQNLKTEFGDTAYIKNVQGADDEKVCQHWAIAHNPIPSYENAMNLICLEREWLCDTVLMRQIRDATTLFKADLEKIKKDGCDGRLDAALDDAIRKGYNTTNPRGQKDLLSGQEVFTKVKQVYSTLEAWKKPYMAHAMELLVRLEQNASAIVAKLAEVVDRSLH